MVKFFSLHYCLACFFPFFFCEGSSCRTLYSSLNQTSIEEHLAFYQLFPKEPLGQKALKEAWELLSKDSSLSPPPHLDPSCLLSALSGLLSLNSESVKPLSEPLLKIIEQLSKPLYNKTLQGCLAKTEEEVLELREEEVDIARALLLTDLGQDLKASSKIRTIEALLDLMALQIRSKLTPSSSCEDKILAINDHVFFTLGFRFPAHSSYSDDIDLYTFLPSVINSRKGVCLGVSLLYLALAQRLDLPLEIITPPGHIYLRYFNPQDQTLRNIETTARGIHLPCEKYLDLELRSLKKRTKKEAIGLAHVNQASTFWKGKKYEKALLCYEKALKYLPDDPQICELMAYNFLFLGNIVEGKRLLEKVQYQSSYDTLSKNTLPLDYLSGKADLLGIQTVLSDPGETRKALLEKKEQLLETIQRCPHFRAAHFALALTYLNLKRTKEAVEALTKYHQLDPKDPSVEYMLTILHLERFDPVLAWKHFTQLETIIQENSLSLEPYPKLLKELKQSLWTLYPKPLN